MKTTKIRQSARGQDCQVRIEGVCNFDSSTVVLAHMPGAGMGIKSNDIHAAHCCSSCHDRVDDRTQTYHTKAQIQAWFYEGMVRTQLLLIEQGLIIIKG